MSRSTKSSNTDDELRHGFGTTLHHDGFTSNADYSSESGGGDKVFLHAFPTSRIPVSAQDGEKMVALESGKQVVDGEEKQPAWGEDTAKIFFDRDGRPTGQTTTDAGHIQEPHVSRVCGLKRRTFIYLMIGIIILVVALAAGIGGGLGASHNRPSAKPSDQPTSASPPSSIPTTPAASPEYAIGGSLDAAYYSRFGAWNGTGLSTTTSANETTAFFFQGFQGELRYIIVLKTTVWNVARTLDTQGEQTGITDAKNSSPISVVVYNTGQESEWHLFYIDRNNQLREKWFHENNHTLETPYRGTLDAQELTAYAGDTVAMGACQGIKTSNGTQPGANLFFASDNSTLQHYAYDFAQNLWTHQYTFNNVNGHAGIACGYDEQTMRLFMTNTNHELESWVLETPDITEDGSKWSKMTITWKNMDPPIMHSSTAIKLFQDEGLFNHTVQDRVIMQLDKDNTLYSYALNYDPKNSTKMSAAQEVPIVAATPGTRIETTITPAGRDVISYKVFCQVPDGIPDIQLYQTNTSSSTLDWRGLGIFSYADLYSPQ